MPVCLRHPRPHRHRHRHWHPRRLHHYHHPRLHLRPYLRLHRAARLRARAPSRAACALQRLYSLQRLQTTPMTHRTNVSESGGTPARGRINLVVTMVMPEVRPTANLEEGYRLGLVVLLSRGWRWTTTRIDGAPVSSVVAVKVVSATRRQHGEALQQRPTLRVRVPCLRAWKMIWESGEGHGVMSPLGVRTRSAAQSAVHGGCGLMKSAPNRDNYERRRVRVIMRNKRLEG